VEQAGTGSNQFHQLIPPHNVYEVSGDGNMTTWQLTSSPPPSIPALGLEHDDEDLINRAKQKALASIDTTPYAFAEDLGELKETFEFLRNPLKNLRNVTKLYKKAVTYKYLKARRRNAARLPEAIASAYLEYRFALSPLVRSIHDLVEAVMTDPKPLPKTRVARGYVKSAVEDHVPFSFSPYAGSVRSFDYRGSSKLGVSAYIHYRQRNPVEDWRRKYGLRFKDIPETAWNLFPLSFMVDRVFNISNTISGLVALLDPSITILGAGYSTKREVYTYMRATGETQTNYQVNVHDTGTSVSDEQYDRYVWEPGVGDTIPTATPLNLVSDITKTADLAGIIYGNVAGILRKR
jgi:hypothetical protein